MSEQTTPAHPSFDQVELGVGTWAWGDRYYWGYGQGYGEEDLKGAFETSLRNEICFFDTAEVYGQGKSEEFLGKFIQSSNLPVLLGSKFMPYPWRFSRSSLIRALKNSLVRLGRTRLDLYQIHLPFPPVTIETWMDSMAEAVQSGLTSAIGVSNFSAHQTQRAYDSLIQQGIRLTSNQVEYHLLNRTIEKNGTMSLCRDLGVRIIAYSPLATGLLTGKYSSEHPPRGMRGRGSNRSLLKKIQPLIALMKKIGAAHQGKTPAQVALNWTICKGTIPIPGAKNAVQAQQNAGAAGWRLTDEEIAALDEASNRVLSEK